MRPGYQKRLQKSYGPCGCCYTWEPERSRERHAGKLEIRDQLTEVPDEQRVFADFRELPDDIFDSHGDFCPCRCAYCSLGEEEVA